MFNNIFRKYDFDNLYIGVVTVYRNKNKKPSCVKVDVPPDEEKVSYVTILFKLNDGAYLEIDNDQCCFYFGQKYKSYSNFPIVSNLISLRDYYEYYQTARRGLRALRCCRTLLRYPGIGDGFSVPLTEAV